MISVVEARNIVFSQVVDWGSELIDIDSSIGRVLAEDVLADRDFPPFDRVTMDGIALHQKAFEEGKRTFDIEHTCYAGDPAYILKDHEAVVEVMTGAVLPEGCNAVIRYEDLDIADHRVKVKIDKLESWKNVHRQGSDALSGSVLVEKGLKIDSGLVAILATVGKTQVLVKKMPNVAIISTGDELVDVVATPKAHQIRKSNTVMMSAALRNINVPNDLFHLNDDKDELRKALEDILARYDVILLSGGVSKGKADFVPEILEVLGVNKLFHRVAQRPGKPFWFGTMGNNKHVFALPGNPISTLMCFRVYFLEWLNHQLEAVNTTKAELAEEFSFAPSLDYFLQVSLKDDGVKKIAYPVVGKGSGDLTNLATSEGFLHLPADRDTFKKGEEFDLYLFS